jgi:hypothetical protein
MDLGVEDSFDSKRSCGKIERRDLPVVQSTEEEIIVDRAQFNVLVLRNGGNPHQRCVSTERARMVDCLAKELAAACSFLQSKQSTVLVSHTERIEVGLTDWEMRHLSFGQFLRFSLVSSSPSVDGSLARSCKADAILAPSLDNV